MIFKYAIFVRMHAIIANKPGDTDVLSYQEIATPKPEHDEVLVKISAIGINYIDIYYRTGLYKMKFPFIPGMEAAGTVAEVGSAVTEFKKGDRIGYVSQQPGSYAEYAIVPASRLIPIPG